MFPRTLVVLLLGGWLPLAAAPRMNVLFISVDDLRMEVGAFGSALARTPHLDRLAAEGVKFDRAYCQYPLKTIMLPPDFAPRPTVPFGARAPPRRPAPRHISGPSGFRPPGQYSMRPHPLLAGRRSGPSRRARATPPMVHAAAWPIGRVRTTRAGFSLATRSLRRAGIIA